MTDDEMMAEGPDVAQQIIAARKRILASLEVKKKPVLPNSDPVK